MKDIVIIGSGGFGREVAWLAADCGRVVRGFLDDQREAGARVQGLPVLGPLKRALEMDDVEFVVAVANPRARRDIVERLEEGGMRRFATLVHPSVMTSGSVRIGEGSIICAGCIATVNISIGRHVIMNVHAVLGHEDQVADFVTLAPKVMVSGDVVLEEGVEVGACTAIRQGLRVGAGAMLGMGSVVTHDVDENILCMGTPARPFRSLSPFGHGHSHAG